MQEFSWSSHLPEVPVDVYSNYRMTIVVFRGKDSDMLPFKDSVGLSHVASSSDENASRRIRDLGVPSLVNDINLSVSRLSHFGPVQVEGIGLIEIIDYEESLSLVILSFPRD